MSVCYFGFWMGKAFWVGSGIFPLYFDDGYDDGFSDDLDGCFENRCCKTDGWLYSFSFV